MILMPEPILAIAIGQVIALIIFTLSVLGWFVNLVQGNQQNGAPRPKNRPRELGQNELEKFLQEVVGGKAQPEKKPPASPPLPQQKQPSQQQQKQPRSGNDNKRGGKNKPQQQRVAREAVASQRPGDRVAQSHLQTSTLGGGVRSHLLSSIEPNRISEVVQHDIGFAVQRDIGSDATSDAIHRAGNIHPVAQALRDPKGLRQAIMLNEILSRPKALR